MNSSDTLLWDSWIERCHAAKHGQKSCNPEVELKLLETSEVFKHEAQWLLTSEEQN